MPAEGAADADFLSSLPGLFQSSLSSSTLPHKPPLDARYTPEHKGLNSLLRSKDVDGALAHFRSFHCTALTCSWNAVLAALAAAKRIADMEALWMRWQSLLPPLTADHSSSAYSSYNLPDNDTYHTLLRCQAFPMTGTTAVHQLRSRGHTPSTEVWNRALKQLLAQDDYPGMRQLLQQMQQAGSPSDLLTFSLRLKLHTREPDAHYRAIELVWDELKASELKPLAPLYMSFAFKMVEHNDVKRMCEVVDALEQLDTDTLAYPLSNVHIVAALKTLSCLTRNNCMTHLLRFYQHLRTIRMPLHVQHFHALLLAFARHGDTTSLMLVFNEMLGHGVEPTLEVFQVMLTGFGKAGDVEGMELVLRRMAQFGVDVDVSCFVHMMKGLREWHVLQLEQALRERKKATGAALRPVQPLSSHLTPYIAMMEEMALTPSSDVYRLLLQALQHEEDLTAVLHYLHHMRRKAVAVDVVALEWCILCVADQPVLAHTGLQLTQLELVVDGVDLLPLAQDTWRALVSVFARHHHIAVMARLYPRMRQAGVEPDQRLLVRLMDACWEADGCVDVKQHQRMQLIVRYYTDLCQLPKQVTDVSVYDVVLSAHAVLGDTESMKAVFQVMKKNRVRVGASTLHVLEQARQHVFYTAEMLNWVLEQKTRLHTYSMESSIKEKRQRAQVTTPSAATQDSPTAATKPPSDAEWLTQAARSLTTGELFALPAWSPFYKAAQAAAAAVSQSSGRDVESILSALVVNLQEHFEQAAKFPLAEAVQAHTVQQVEEGPCEEELRAITAQIQQLQQQWPTIACLPISEVAVPAGEHREVGQAARELPIPTLQSEEAAETPISHSHGVDEGRRAEREVVVMRAIDDRSRAPSLDRFARMVAASEFRQAAEAESIPLPVDLPPRSTASPTVSSFRPVVRHTSSGPIGASTPFSSRAAPIALKRSRAVTSVVSAANPAVPSQLALSSPLLPMPRVKPPVAAADQQSSTRAAGRKEEKGRRKTVTKPKSKSDPYHGGWM